MSVPSDEHEIGKVLERARRDHRRSIRVRRTRRAALIMLAALMSLTAMLFMAFKVSEAPTYGGGFGRENDPYRNSSPWLLGAPALWPALVILGCRWHAKRRTEDER